MLSPRSYPISYGNLWTLWGSNPGPADYESVALTD